MAHETRSERLDRWFRSGVIAAEVDWPGPSRQCPFTEGSEGEHWWTRGYAYSVRMLAWHATKSELEDKAAFLALASIGLAFTFAAYELGSNGEPWFSQSFFVG